MTTIKGKKSDYWDNYEEVNVDGKVRFKCILGCEDSWVKNETRLKEHSENCSKQTRASNYNQTTLDNNNKVVSKQSQKVYEILLTCAFISLGIPFNVIENPDFLAFLQKTNPSYTVPSHYRISNILATLYHLQQEKYRHEIGLRLNLKHLYDFLKPFANFIYMIESNHLLLSTAYVKFNKLQNFVKNNQQIPKEISSQAVKFGNNRCDKEIIQLAGNKPSELVLKELANYIGKIVSNCASNLSEVALKVFSIPASSASSERNWFTFGFTLSKNHNRLNVKRVEKLVYLYWNLRILQQLNQLINYNYNGLDININKTMM
ncbi:6110_t:CDS:2, partial [Dentiscutata erythropus]